MTRRAWNLLAVLVALCVVTPFAHALTGTIVSPGGGMALTYSPNGVRMVDAISGSESFIGRTFATASNGAATVAENYGVQIGGHAVPVAATRALSAGAVAAAIAAAAIAGVEIGGALQHAIGQDASVSIGSSRCTTVAFGWQCDAGTAPPHGEPVLWWGWAGMPNPSSPYATASSACDAFQIPNYLTVYSDTSASCYQSYANAQYGSGNSASLQRTYGTLASAGCRATIDALNPAWSTPDGTPPGPDGKCATGRYSPKTVVEVVPLLMPAIVNSPTYVPQALEEVLTRGVPIPDAGPRVLTGPATVTDPTPNTTTTTPPGGSPVTTTVYNTTNYHFDGDTVTYNTTTTTTAPDGTTQTQDRPNADPTDPCTANPGRLGCLKLGDPGADKPVWQSRELSFAEIAFPSGSCPPDRVFTFHGWALPLKYEPLCTAAPAVNAGMVAFSMLMAIGLITKTVSR